MENWFRGNDEGVEDTPEYRDPVVNDPQCAGLQISTVPFSELIKVFPNTSVVRFIFISVGKVQRVDSFLVGRIDYFNRGRRGQGTIEEPDAEIG
jgi:hypothetical protein